MGRIELVVPTSHQDVNDLVGRPHPLGFRFHRLAPHPRAAHRVPTPQRQGQHGPIPVLSNSLGPLAGKQVVRNYHLHSRSRYLLPRLRSFLRPNPLQLWRPFEQTHDSADCGWRSNLFLLRTRLKAILRLRLVLR